MHCYTVLDIDWGTNPREMVKLTIFECTTRLLKHRFVTIYIGKRLTNKHISLPHPAQAIVLLLHNGGSHLIEPVLPVLH